MSPKVVRNIEAGVVFVGAAALLIWVPGEWFLEVAMAMLVGSIGAVFGIRKYIDRLDAEAKSLQSSGRPEEATVLRVRKVMLVDSGVAIAIVGLTAFIALLVVYAD
jgi:hypothetical protein